MLVETYEVEETTSEAAGLAADAEAAELITRLELTGQQKLLNPETVTRFPYRKMTKHEAQVYGILCPRKTAITNYDDGIIPIRVLQVAAHVHELRFVDRIQVWHPENADIKDPVLVGVKGPEYGDQQLFMLARWGGELPSFSELAQKALEMFRAKRLTVLKGIAGEVQGAIAECDTLGEIGDLPVFYAR